METNFGWQEDARRERKWDEFLRSRPVCVDCKRPITEEKGLPTEDGMVCPKCVGWRMVEIER